MSELPFISDILKLSVAGILVFFVVWYFIKDHLHGPLQANAFELKKETISHTLPLRLQAYERVVLFLERINPSSMLLRLHVPGMSADEMHNIILSDIRAEYQHNITQQIYVSPATWAVVKRLKEDTISMVNNAVKGLPENAGSVDLSRVILTHLAKLEDKNPYDAALELVKRDIQILF